MMRIVNYLIFFAIFAILGFSREFLFVNTNNLMYKIYYHNDSIIIPESLDFLSKYSLDTIYYGKYALTILYFIFYFIASYFAVKIICSDKKVTTWIVYIYGLILLLSSLTMAYNYIINNQLSGDEYTFSRWLMGIAQSPLVAFFTIAASALKTKFNPDKN